MSQQALSAYSQAVSRHTLDRLFKEHCILYISIDYLANCMYCLFQEKIDKASALNADLHFNRATVILLFLLLLCSFKLMIHLFRLTPTYKVSLALHNEQSFSGSILGFASIDSVNML